MPISESLKRAQKKYHEKNREVRIEICRKYKEAHHEEIKAKQNLKYALLHSDSKKALKNPFYMFPLIEAFK